MKNDKSIDSLNFAKAFQICISSLNHNNKVTTISNYSYSVSSLIRYVEKLSNCSLTDISPEYFSANIIRGAMKWKLDNGNSPQSVNTFLSNIRGLINHICIKDPTFIYLQIELKNIKPYKAIKANVPPLTEEEHHNILMAPRTTTNTGLKYTTLLTIASTSALRVSEITNIKIQDLNFDKGREHIKVVGKGNKSRVVTIANQAVPLINEYIKRFHGTNPIGNDYLFYSVRNGYHQRMTRSGVSKQLKKYVIETFGKDYEKKIHMHTLRHTGATAMYSNGINLGQISKFLGHSYLDTTLTYVKIQNKSIKSHLEKVPTPSKIVIKKNLSDIVELLDL